MARCVFAVAALIFCCLLEVSQCSFVIDYEKNTFSLNGKPFRYVSGSLHYFRIPREYWRDRLRKCRAAGLNAVSTYVEWNQHEAKPGVFDFSGDRNVSEFIRIAKDEGLYVILRPGPYICAERDMGGLPFWLLHHHPHMQLRTKDRNYTMYVERWMSVLLREVSPLLYGRGGPILLVQVENEYGSYAACDRDYMIWLRDLFLKFVGNDAVLFTTDGAGRNFLKCGKVPGVYATVDFGPFSHVRTAFVAQRMFEPKGPLVNSEYYPGWLTHWGTKMARVDTVNVTQTLRKMLDLGANVNFYMFHGGTNFGFTGGANTVPEYAPDVTSYDYDAPISEAGDLTGKYYAIREVLKEYMTVDENITVTTSKKGAYGEVELTATANFLSPRVMALLGETIHSRRPLSFEDVFQNSGFIIYETELKWSDHQVYLQVPGIRDNANVYLNGLYLGTLTREFKTTEVYVRSVSVGDRLTLVVENLGRISYGSQLNDRKGILSSVLLGGKSLEGWNMTKVELNSVQPLAACFSPGRRDESCLSGGGYNFFVGTFTVPANSTPYPLDSFLDVSNLTKGVVFVNDHNLGRYWSTRGPQYTLYTPGVYLRPEPEQNVITVMDEYITADSIRVRFSTKPIFI